MMLMQAFHGEAYRALRNRRALIWAYAAVPIFILIFGLAIELAIRIETMAAIPPVQPVRLAVRSLGAGGNAIAQLFYAIGAAGLVANEYRWESWRLIAPRNTRANLILAKVAVYMLCVAASLTAIVGAELVSGLVSATVKGSPLVWPDAAGWWALATAWAGSLLELTTLGALAMAGAAATRSLLGGAMLAFLLSLGQSLMLAFDPPPPGINPAIALPTQAGDMVRGLAHGFSSATDAIAGAGMLALWTIVLTAAAVLIFSRQDLSRE